MELRPHCGVNYGEFVRSLYSQVTLAHATTIKQVLADTNRPHTQSWSCCAQSWTMSVIDRRQSSVDCWQHWQRWTCRREIILSSEVGEKLQKELRLSLEMNFVFVA